MNKHVVYLGGGGGDAPEWTEALEQADFRLLRAETPEQAGQYLRTWPVVALLIRLDGETEKLWEGAGHLLPAQENPRYAAIGIAPEAQGGGSSLARWGEMRLTGCYREGDPPRFLVYALKSLQSLQALTAQRDDGMDVEKLAVETRKLVHETSQPLAALQGRLQLTLNKLPDDDPMKGFYKTLTDMAMDVSRNLREIQELHRKYS